MNASTKRAPSRNGSALLIILAFVLLLTIITTAFLSKALLEKTVSNASADQTRTDVFAAGAVDAILSDCQQEIAAGSAAPTTTPAVYIPASAKTIVPSRMAAGSSKTAIGFPNSSTLANLLKCSSVGVPFYPNGDAADFPKATLYPPSEATLSSDPSHYDSTSTASLNGRSYSSIRWNQALLLPKKTLTSNTDYTPNSNFTVPDWILVQRDGSNPTAWTTSLCVASPTDVTTANKNPVVGRYAYAIYDEGGLLDMNVAGYPSTAGPSSATTHFYRSSLATVDLTQLINPSTSTAFFPNVDGTKNPGNPIIDAIVGWRNNATLQASGTTPNYTFTAAVATNYFFNVLPPGTGFMHATVPTSVTALTTGQSDRKFSSRQQLIDLLLNQIAPSLPGNTTPANMQNALQYMGTFSRDLSQPSYQPDPARPRMKANTSQNGTDGVLDVALYGGNASASDDSSNYINVPFASTLVQAAFTRNDGSAASVGDPLVKKRFALNRLAWLTFNGPIADDSGNLNPSGNTALANIITQLETNYGYTAAFLAQGGPTNIKNYFGLTWATDSTDNSRSKWFYNIHNNSSGATGKGIIRELGGPNGIAASGDTSAHDPDFFELLKAAILTGSKGKSLTYLSGTNNPTDPLHPWNLQNTIDVSLDYQILQIGANIIDQSRIDGYTTEIVFDNGTGPFEVRGIENYPYLYRVREGAMALRNPVTSVPDSQFKDTAAPVDSTGGYPAFKDTGVAALMQIPEVWNPHDVNAPMGSPYPYYFRVVMDTTDPKSLQSGTFTPSAIIVVGQDTVAQGDTLTVNNALSNNSTTASNNSPVFSFNPVGAGGQITGGYSPTGTTFSPANTALTFNIPNVSSSGVVTAPNSTVFREPTMLVRPNVPSGSNLSMWTPAAGSDLTKVENSAGKLCYATNALGTGLLSDTPNPLNLPTAPGSSPAPLYFGVVLGLYPIEWELPKSGVKYIYYSSIAYPSLSPNTYFTYRMQYADPVLNPTGSSTGAWVTYDVKYLTPKAKWPWTPSVAGPGGLVDPNKLIGNYQADSWVSYADPRTSRFGAPGGDNDAFFTTMYASPGNYATDWLDQANGVLASDRPDYKQGYVYESYRSADSWYLSSLFAPGWSSANGNGYSTFRWGPISQNTMATTTDANVLRYSGDSATASPALTFQSFYYADADGVVRRAMGGQVPLNSATAPTPASAKLYGYPMATATVGYSYPGALGVVNSNQSSSRPYILKRPFRSVAELGYVFSGTPWKNLDFSNPESGDSPLLDVFCINDTDDPNALVAGKVNLNTQQSPVLAAILAESYYNDFSPNSTVPNSGSFIGSTDPILSSGTAYSTAASSLANYLVTGPSGTTGTAVTPLMNVRELVGKYVGAAQTAGTMGIDGTATSNFAGYSTDIGAFYNPASGAGASYFNAYQTRFREAAVRALSAVGQTRVWNLMIDVVAQTGRFPSTASNASNFLVEGERRYWVHVAIDRYTGNILDCQIEEVRQ